ncbi:hypothetical protein ACROYT_G023341 [Oculina patagonica]
MRTPINYLLVNLAISDITFAAFVAPNHILNETFTHPGGTIGKGLCMLVTGGNVAWVGAASSSVTLVAIAVERYFTVMCPLGSRGKLSKRKVKVIIPCCWIFAWALNMPLILVTTFDESIGDCIWDWPESWMGAANETTWLVLLAIIPLIVMTGLYSRVVYTLWFKRNDSHELAFRQKGVIKVRKRVTLSVITVSAIFGVCWITGLLVYILSYYDIYMFGPASYTISDTMFMFNSTINPLVYALLNERFRGKLKKMLCSSCATRVYPSSDPYSIELPNNTSHVTRTAGGSMD